MENQSYNLMKYSYTTFLKQKHDNGAESPTWPKYNSYIRVSGGVVGIKFDNISDGKLFTRIFNTQEQTIVKKEVLCNWLFLLAGSHVTKWSRLKRDG